MPLLQLAQLLALYVTSYYVGLRCFLTTHIGGNRLVVR
jgi:hypothetical protein